MKIQDFESRNAEKQEKTKNSSMKPEEIKIKIQKYLKKYLEFTKNKNLYELIQQSISVINKFSENQSNNDQFCTKCEEQ